MRIERCRHCGQVRWDHIGIGGELLCATTFEAEDPTCGGCEEGWPESKRDRRRHYAGESVMTCEINDGVIHSIPAGDTEGGES